MSFHVHLGEGNPSDGKAVRSVSEPLPFQQPSVPFVGSSCSMLLEDLFPLLRTEKCFTDANTWRPMAWKVWEVFGFRLGSLRGP